MRPVTRFAPSPTGYLHPGHAYSAILNAHAGARFLLRIEDIDNTRCKPEYETAIYEDLAWLGLAWERPVRRQSERLAVYEAQLREWHARGLVYRCFKTRKDIADSMGAPHAHAHAQAFTGAPDPREDEKLARGLPFSWRLNMARAIEITGERAAARHGDVILGRKDVGTSYHLACVMDDADQGVTQIIRGEDLADIADLHILIFRLLGHTPPEITHHKMILDPKTGKRFAKRDHSITLHALRKQGWTPADIRAYVGLD
ncbi:MAG: tRNA glutamyl-Q(34) synthetase GluQRS [Rhodospirillales bacterium]|nr:tRNA glutamyl-Q(34) synthetase GluQRS [Alphaproteobacteria bacterium]MCB9986913.1 tRNA glutamyl-Q(34) synthetase GluQRS [Rhodospirillales bacterium]USO08579.1 MAG: tRNA glutamyl-Q(34) synthetase GluQRS [Rhodospirillales bacterium]